MESSNIHVSIIKIYSPIYKIQYIYSLHIEKYSPDINMNIHYDTEPVYKNKNFHYIILVYFLHAYMNIHYDIESVYKIKNFNFIILTYMYIILYKKELQENSMF